MATDQIERAPIRKPEPPRGVASGVVALIVVLVVVQVLWRQRQGITDQWHATFGPQVEVRLSSESIPAGPLKRRVDASAVWTGSRMIVWGGVASAGNFTHINHADGASYDPTTQTWTPIAPSPLSGREQHMAVWTGKEMIVWGGVRRVSEGMPAQYDGAAYDPVTDRWRRIADAPRAGFGANMAAPTGVMWGGKVAVVVQPDQTRGEPGPLTSILLYDVATDHWEEVPLGERPLHAVIYRDSLAVLGGIPDGGFRMNETGDSRDEPWLKLISPDAQGGGVRDVPLPPLSGRPMTVGMVATASGLVLAFDNDRTTMVTYRSDPSQHAGHDLVPEVTTRPQGTVFAPPDLLVGGPTIAGALGERYVVTYTGHGGSVIDMSTGAVERVDLWQDFCGYPAALAWTGTQLLAWGDKACRDASRPQKTTGGVAYTLQVVP